MSQSPFPGMDPYLEQFWRDVQHRLITYSTDQLQRQLPGQLRARMEERVFVTGEEGMLGQRVPDVHVVGYPPRRSESASATAVAEVVQPYIVELPREEVTETYIEITDAASGNRVITVIEFLSPTNKLAGPGRDEYVRKRKEYKQADVNLVEIDLTRQGPRAAVLPVDSIPLEHHTTYLICIERNRRLSRLEYYPIPLSSALPTIVIPLRPDDKDAALDLQSLVDQAYVNGRYDDFDYSRPPNPPLTADDAAWVAEHLKFPKTG